jgi:hypothetical protein
MLLLVHISADFLYTADLFPATSTDRTLKYAQAPSLEKAHIVVRSDGQAQEIVIERLTGLMSYQREIRVALNGGTTYLADAFDGIAHFNYFLDHTNDAEECRLKDMFTLEMHHLQGTYPCRTPGTNMVKDGVVEFASEAGAKYGYTICSNKDCPDDLFPYLFWFDPDEYTITVSMARNTDYVLIFVR